MPLYQPPRTSLAHQGQSPKEILSHDSSRAQRLPSTQAAHRLRRADRLGLIRGNPIQVSTSLESFALQRYSEFSQGLVRLMEEERFVAFMDPQRAEESYFLWSPLSFPLPSSTVERG